MTFYVVAAFIAGVGTGVAGLAFTLVYVDWGKH